MSKLKRYFIFGVVLGIFLTVSVLLANFLYLKNDVSVKSIDKYSDELSGKDKVEYSSVIVFSRYEEISDGSLVPLVVKILKQDEDLNGYFSIGDRVESKLLYLMDDVKEGDEVIALFYGNPPVNRIVQRSSGGSVYKDKPPSLEVLAVMLGE